MRRQFWCARRLSVDLGVGAPGRRGVPDARARSHPRRTRAAGLTKPPEVPGEPLKNEIPPRSSKP